MKPKIVFLDIDGVMNNPTNWGRRGEGAILRHTCEMMNEVVKKTDCKIVISSTWRKIYPVCEIRKFFMSHGWRAPIIGRTPDSRDGFRGGEVAEYLKMMNLEDPTYVCVDDEGDFFPHQPLVQTSGYVGLTQADADKIVAILNGKEVQKLAVYEYK